jgi:hypothetical protein
MLPKMKPAAAESARPVIRPVKASPPGPAPAPPTRRYPSGVSSKRGGTMNLVPDLEVHVEDEDKMTAIAPWTEQYPEPPTGPTPIAIAQPVPRQRTNVVVGFEDETQARPADEYLLQSMRDQEQQQGPLNVAYESLPSLEARRPFDAYEAEFAERDPVTQMVAAHESIRIRRAQEQRHQEMMPPPEQTYEQQPAYDEQPYDLQPQAYEQQYDYAPATAREDSGPRERPTEDDPRTYAPPPPPYDEMHASYQSGPQERGWSDAPLRTEIPPAPPVPREMRFHTPPSFIHGVQPIRPANNFSVMTPPPQPPPMYQSPAPPPMYQHQHQQQRMAVTEPSSRMQAYPMQPVGQQVETPPKSGVARFAWFVFGATFGIVFAFCATGYVPRFGQPEPLFPPPPPRPAVTATAPATPAQAVTAPPATNAIVAAPPPTATTTAPIPAPPPTATAKDTKAPTAGATAARTPPPPPRRFFSPPPRRPAPPPSDSPKKSGGSVDAPDPPSSGGGGGGAIDNILGDALK